tara:strand:+ start:118 stop:360 length:243 start_codon:yes stop_codon:yes gene_type:complete
MYFKTKQGVLIRFDITTVFSMTSVTLQEILHDHPKQEVDDSRGHQNAITPPDVMICPGNATENESCCDNGKPQSLRKRLA